MLVKIKQPVSRYIMMFLLQFAVILSATAQNRTVTGKISDSNAGTPLNGATITAKGTSNSTVSGETGNFSIEVPAGVNSLVISFSGYSTREVAITGSVLNIGLEISSSTLGDVVVIGYGSTRRKDLTGSIATVGSKDFVKGALTTPEQLIQGKVAGVQITSNSGAPGAGSTIRIRGGASLNASNDPLIVIDGMPLDNGGISGQANALALINP
ncbi:MAG: hypothetical protein RL766_980, partial [Bacteroidota bacterium]